MANMRSIILIQDYVGLVNCFLDDLRVIYAVSLFLDIGQKTLEEKCTNCANCDIRKYNLDRRCKNTTWDSKT